MTFPSPTIGRIVWYTPSTLELTHTTTTQISPEQKFPAVVVYVHNQHSVNLSVIDHHGNHFPREHVPLLAPTDTPFAEGGYCEWMPYQLAQAAKEASA